MTHLKVSAPNEINYPFPIKWCSAHHWRWDKILWYKTRTYNAKQSVVLQLIQSILQYFKNTCGKQMDICNNISLCLACPYSSFSTCCSVSLFSSTITLKKIKYLHLHDFSSCFHPSTYAFSFAHTFALLSLDTTFIQIIYNSKITSSTNNKVPKYPLSSVIKCAFHQNKSYS